MAEDKKKKDLIAEDSDNKASQKAEESLKEAQIPEGKTIDSIDGEELALDDARRIKVISPGMLVLRRFLRNRLAIAGIIILVVMFIFSFIGGLISPYGQAETFKRHEERLKLFAGAQKNDDFRYVTAEGFDFPNLARARFIQAKNAGIETFESSGHKYLHKQIKDDCHVIYAADKLADVILVGKFADIKPVEGADLPEGFNEAVTAAVAAKEKEFVIDDETYQILDAEGLNKEIVANAPKAMANKKVLSFDNKADEAMSFDIQYNLEAALLAGENSFEIDGKTYKIDQKSEDYSEIIGPDGEIFATSGYYAVEPVTATTFLPLSFKAKVVDAIDNHEESFTASIKEGGEEEEFTINKKEGRFQINAYESTYIYDEFAAPSKEHWLGTDRNGMDAVTRLMYGGRISLLVGFVVVVIELVIGVTLGGIAGFFGGWVDMLIMRIVDIMYCIPTWPILIILGSVMDVQRVTPGQRMLAIMIVLGLLGWAGITRMVRGQILSLREQEFMIAAEATGLSTKRRIFRHLVPNVMPQLIVLATLGLGGTILTESTLSFLGIGVKFPYASWGNIVNSVSDQYVMMNFPQAWIPAGFCILITVLAFNFVGDGLRDAFDPKMKR